MVPFSVVLKIFNQLKKFPNLEAKVPVLQSLQCLSGNLKVFLCVSLLVFIDILWHIFSSFWQNITTQLF